MIMRLNYTILYLLLIFALIGCSVLAKRSDRPSKNAVALLESALILPILGNLLIICSRVEVIALSGCYLYYLGMDLVMYGLVNFTNQYCKGMAGGTGKRKPTAMYVLLIADTVQILMNIFTGHAFGIAPIAEESYMHYKMIPYWGQTVHRVIDYFIFCCVLLIFLLASVKTPKIARERYTVLLFTMLFVSLMLTFNIITQSPIDRSMIGFAVFGMVIFYFAIKYRPLRLLDKVLSSIVSDLSDAFYVFDPNGVCIWANSQGKKLAGITGDNYHDVTANLMKIFGSAGDPSQNLTKIKVGEGEDVRYYLIEKNQVKGVKDQIDGSYLRIQDITKEEIALQTRDEQIGQIKLEAYRDALTGVGSKTAYNQKVAELNSNIADGHTEFAVVMVDLNDLKRINDDYGHKAGDLYIKGCCRLICNAFKHSPVFRIGGDEFVVTLEGDDYINRVQLSETLRSAYMESFERTDLDPWQRYSAAVGLAGNASDDNTYELVFKRADKAMYDQKKLFKEKFGSYR